MVKASVERFGYILDGIFESEERAIKEITKNYKKAYRNRNNYEPTRQELASMRYDIVIENVVLNLVEWH